MDEDKSGVKEQVAALWEAISPGLKRAKDEVVSAAHTAQERVNLTRMRRQRDRMLQVLGEQVFRLAQEGKVELPEEARNTVNGIEELVKQIHQAREQQEGAREVPVEYVEEKEKK